jgi:hypothetical protein
MLRIKDWDKHFENNRTRELKKLDWVPVPNDLDGDGYTELMDHPNGAAHLGAWLAIVQIASKCDVRGTLSRKGARSHDAHSLARISRVSPEIFAEAIPRLADIGWLEELDAEGKVVQRLTDIPQGGAVIPQGGAALEPQDDAPRVRVRREGKEGNLSTSAGADSESSPDSEDTEPEAPVSEKTVSPSDQAIEDLVKHLCSNHRSAHYKAPSLVRKKIQTVLGKVSKRKAEWPALCLVAAENYELDCKGLWAGKEPKYIDALTNWLVPEVFTDRKQSQIPFTEPPKQQPPLNCPPKGLTPAEYDAMYGAGWYDLVGQNLGLHPRLA